MRYKRPSLSKRVLGDRVEPVSWIEQMVEDNKKYMQIRSAGFRALGKKQMKQLMEIKEDKDEVQISQG
jgi:hypothetical protein